MGGSKFIPIVVAGLVGLFIGWLLGPDIDDVSDEVSGQVASLQAPVTEIQTGMQSMSDEVSSRLDQTDTGVSEAVAGLQSQIETLAQTVETRTSELANAVQAQADQAGGDVEGGIEELKSEIAQLQESMSQMAEREPAAQSDSGSGMGSLAEQVGPSGAILLSGQSALFGSGRVSVSEVSDGSAQIAAGDGEAQEVSSGDSVDVGDGCSVTLAGTAGGAAFLSSEGCGSESTAAAASGSSDESSGGSSDQQQAAEASGSDEGATDQGAAAAAATSGSASGGQASDTGGSESASASSGSSGSDGSGDGMTPVGGTAQFGNTSVFVSGIREDSAMLMVVGGSRENVSVGSSLDAGDGCSITLDSVENNMASLSASGCGGEGSSSDQAAQSADDSSSDQEAQSSQQSNDSAGSDQAATSSSGETSEEGETAAADQSSGEGSDEAASGSEQAASSGSASGDSFETGQTATFGNKRVFLSGIGDNNATLFVVGPSDRQTLEVGSSIDLGDGCTVTVESVEGRRASLSTSGCGGEGEAATSGGDNSGASSGEETESSQQDAASDAGSSDDAASSEATENSASASSSSNGESQTASASSSGEGLETGQTQTFGDHKVFVSSVTDSGATLYIVGSGRQQVASGESADLGDGCSVSLDRIENRMAYLSASGC